MKKYYTISEFAKFRNLNINSIRYYEKLGFLTPAYTDPETKYRYYSFRQLNELDWIILCTDYGIPVKNLKKYIQADGELTEKELLEDSRKLAIERIRSAKADLERIDYTLHCIEKNRPYAETEGIYKRIIGKRLFATAECTDILHNPRKTEPRLQELYKYCGRLGLRPMLPCGFFFLYSGGFSARLFLECTGEVPDDPNVFIIPEAEFTCVQMMSGTGVLIEEAAQDFFHPEDNSIVIMPKLLLDTIPIKGERIEFEYLPGGIDRIIRTGS